MASLRDAVSSNADELRGGIAWVVFWREGRSWNSDYIYLDPTTDTIEYDDIGRLEYISHTDPRAVALNGYYCGRLGEDMTLDELTKGVRWHYENNYNTLTGFIEEKDSRLPPDQLEAAREAAHAAGLPFSERPYDGRELDPYVYDGSMTPEDYELWQQLIAQERSAELDDFISLEAYISNLGKYTEHTPAGEWVRFPTTAENMKAVFDRIGIDGKNYEEWHITEYRSDFPGLTRHLSEFESLDELNYLGKLLEMQRDSDRDIFTAAVTHGEYASSVKDLINLAQNLDCYWLYPTVQSEEDYGYYLIDELDAMELPEAAKKYFDYEAYGRDSIINEGGELTKQGYIYNNRNTFTEWYEGRDVPEEYRVTPQFSQPELTATPDAPDKEYDAVAAVVTEPPPEVAAVPLPVQVIPLDSQKPAEKLKEITDKLEQGIAGIFESEQYTDYLKTLSKFHNYSLNNTILIAMQKPDASLVAGFNTWKNEFERNVMKGQKGIKIIAPSPYKVKVQQEKTDPATGKPVIGADGKPVTEETERKIPAYKVVSVFDVSQTEGKEIPTIGADILTGDVEQYKDFFAALEKASPVPVAFEPIEGGANGYYHQVEKRIAIDEGMSQLQTLKTAIHEVAHARLHDIDRDKEQGEDAPPRPDKRTREVEAESVAYTVCQHYGLDTSDYSFGYIAGWSSGKELAELKASLDTIRTTAAQLITEIDGHFAELQQDRTQTVKQEQQATQPQPEPQPGFEEWSEPATANNAPDNPGEPSDDIDAYLPPQGDPPAQQPEQAEPTPAVTYYPISEEAARRAKEAISYNDYRPGSATAEYRQMVDKAVEVAARQKSRVDPMHHEKIDRLLDTYARKLAENMNNGYAITARVPSMLITGGGNFPVRKKEKQNAASDKNMQEWRDIQGLLDKIRSTGMGGISADDPTAKEKLQSKLAGLEQTQETMKTANAYYRKHKTLDGCPVLSSEQIHKLTADMKSRWYGREATQPFEPYALQNNNAEIRRVKARIEELNHKEEAVLTGWEFAGGKVEVNKQENRLQVFFDGKPDADTRAELKGNGFRWAPSVGAWQRQLNGNAFYAANHVKSIQPLTGEKPTDLQRRAAQEARAAQQPEQQAAPEQEHQQGDTYAIYQLKQDDSTRDVRFEPYDRIQAAGLTVDPANYVFVYAGQLGKDETLDTIFERFNISHPEDFTGHSLSVSDVVTLNRDGKETAHYVDSFGFKDVPEFFSPAPAFDMQQTADYLQLLNDKVIHANPNKVAGMAVYNVVLKRLDRLNSQIPDDQPQLKAAISHAAESTDLTMLKQRMGVAMQEVSHIRTAELSNEQNYNMIDGILNNTPSVGELEARAKTGEPISLYDLATAIKAERSDRDQDTGKKPSIREQLKAAQEERKENPPQQRSRDKSPGLEV